MQKFKQQYSINTNIDQRNIAAELIKVLYQQANTALLGVIATATGIAYVFYNAVPNGIVIGWLFVIYLLSLFRYFSIQKFNHKKRNSIDVIQWGYLFAGFVFLSGLSWGAASLIFFTADNLQLFNILTLIIIAMSVGSLAALSAYPNAYYLFVVPAMLPMIWRYLGIDDANYNIFGYLLFIFNFALFSIVRINHRILRDSIVLQFEKTELVEQLTQQKEKAEKANASKTKFLAAASHDIRQPIHAIGLFLGILEDKVEKDDQKIIVHKIQKSSQALNELLDSLLDISKLDAGVIKAKSKVFCFSDLYDALKNEFLPLAEEKGLKITFVETSVCVNSDIQIMERIIRNLISNAIRYTGKGGVVVGCRHQQGNVLLAVYDTGLGIADAEIEEVFSEFHQLHNPERDRSKGLGLGLSIVQRMTKVIGATIFVKSIEGQGSVFGVVIPMAEKTFNRNVCIDESSADIYFDGYTVLVVDDEIAISESLSELLQTWHCHVLVATSLSTALEVLGKENIKPDIMLVDYRLKNNETGFDVIRKVNDLYASSKIPAIVITGETDPARIKKADMSEYPILHKPVTPSKLRLLLAKTLKA